MIKLALKYAARFRFHHGPVLAALLRKASRHKQTGILETYDGEVFHQNGIYAIFVLWQPEITPWYVDNALDALNEANINTLVIVNQMLPPARIVPLRAKSWRIIIRDNSGFDFGAYKCGTLELLPLQPQRVLYLNDSVYYFRTGLADFFRRLVTSATEASGAFESFQFTHHIQSFCISVSKNIFEHPRYIAFWKNYLAANSRRWSIRRGELQLGLLLSEISGEFDIVYSIDKLSAALKTLPSESLISVPIKLSKTARARINRLDNVTVGEAIDRIMGVLRGGSLIHDAGFLCRRLLGCPIMKRDLIWRNLYDVHEAHMLLKWAGDEGHLGEIIDDLNRRGNGRFLKGWKRVKFQQGII